MPHYVCEGDCKGVSETPGTCGMEGCSMHEKDLKECNCEGGAEAHRATAERAE